VIPYEAQLDPSGTVLYVTGLGQGLVAIVDVDRGQQRAAITEEAFAGLAGYFALSPDGSTLAIPSGVGSISVYAVPEGRLVAQLRTHNETVAVVRWDGDGQRLLAIGQSGVAKIVDVATGAGTEPGFRGLKTAVRNGFRPFSPDGRLLLMGAAVRTSSTMLLIDLDPAVWARRACELAGRNLTAAEWETYLPNAGAHRRTCEQWPDGLV
jgi:WD40 repeat protein